MWNSNIVCPLCQYHGTKALVGVFPVKLCLDAHCSCAWGFWSNIAFWMADKLQPRNGVWAILAYDGSYFKALWFSLFGGK